MASFNKVILLGNLTRDPEVRYTPKGTAVTDLGLAVNRTYTADNGEKREEVTFVDVTFWGRTAEVAGEYLKKGRPVFVEGRLQLDSWDDKTKSGPKTDQTQRHRGKQAEARRSSWRWRRRRRRGRWFQRASFQQPAGSAPESSSLRPGRRRDSRSNICSALCVL